MPAKQKVYDLILETEFENTKIHALKDLKVKIRAWKDLKLLPHGLSVNPQKLVNDMRSYAQAQAQEPELDIQILADKLLDQFDLCACSVIINGVGVVAYDAEEWSGRNLPDHK